MEVNMRTCNIPECNETKDLTEVTPEYVGEKNGEMYYQQPRRLCPKHLEEYLKSSEKKLK